MKRTDRTVNPVDGIRIRELNCSHRTAVYQLHAGLSARDAYLRFFGSRPNHLSALAKTLCGSSSRHYALGAFEGPVLVGVAYYVLVDTSPGHMTAELAVVVSEHRQQQGIGTLLVRRLCSAALARGVTRVTAEVLAENTLMLAVITELGWAQALHRQGTTMHFDLDLRRADERAHDEPVPDSLCRRPEG